MPTASVRRAGFGSPSLRCPVETTGPIRTNTAVAREAEGWPSGVARYLDGGAAGTSSILWRRRIHQSGRKTSVIDVGARHSGTPLARPSGDCLCHEGRPWIQLMSALRTNGELLRELREQQRLTRPQLAERTRSVDKKGKGVSDDTIESAENGGPVLEENLTLILRALGLSVSVDYVIAHEVPGIPPSPLLEKITQRDLWGELERRVREIATSGGMVAQGFYRNAGPRLNAWVDRDGAIDSLIREYESESKNPPTKADLVATQAILREAESLLSPMAAQLGCGLQFLCEETVKPAFESWLRGALGDAYWRVQKPADFFGERNGYGTMRVIADAIDGTMNFVNGIPLYCAAVALLIDDTPRVAAIYEPLHGIVYTAILPGPRTRLEEGATATAWEIASGNCTDLRARVTADDTPGEDLSNQTVALHLTRSNREKRQELVKKLDGIVEASRGIVALNAGLPAMALVARGGLGAFLNNLTNLWDVAAGETLIRACGGFVTQFDGSELSYSRPDKVSIVAAKNSKIHTKIRALLAV
jgi:fructose-1,6-bisphosphatase/inositol monophosphatase family enzyme/transcriptional regulator with XRE-family HTH domain